MMDDSLRNYLGVQGERRQWFSGLKVDPPGSLPSRQISGVGKPIHHAMRKVYSVSNLSLPMKTLRRRDVQSVNKDASLPMRPYSKAVPNILIGLDHGHLGLNLRSRRFARQAPYAAATELGWVVFGPISGQTCLHHGLVS
ncbi:GL10076 [Drosophila persimilis]|uniref:GL10076 n=1 Tax=Drosophila persimilis TaxID=7234 RepID=B4HCF1_DROPE|nr:GL10076 [Drosophila persimilis]